MQGGRGDTRAGCARSMRPRDLIRRGMFTLLVASVLHVVGAEARARSCVERPLGEYSVIFGARIVQKLPNNKMILAIEHVLRGNETRKNLIVDYGNVMYGPTETYSNRVPNGFLLSRKKQRNTISYFARQYISRYKTENYP